MNILEQIKKQFILPDAYKDWENYRDTITDYLISECQQASMPLCFTSSTLAETHLPSLAIVGAGNCNDFDLSKLIQHFSKLTLIDCDENSLAHAKAFYKLPKDAVHTITHSLTGINDTDYQTFIERLRDYANTIPHEALVADFQDYAIHTLEEILSQYENQIFFPKEKYDYIVCFGVHSQLLTVFSYIYNIFTAHFKEKNLVISCDEFDRFMKEKNAVLITNLNTALIRCANCGVILGMEWDRLYSIDDPYTITDIPLNGVEGAYQGICDIRKRHLATKESTLLWPFDPSQNIYYQMIIQNISTIDS